VQHLDDHGPSFIRVGVLSGYAGSSSAGLELFVIVFGVFAVISLWLYRSRIGHVLDPKTIVMVKQHRPSFSSDDYFDPRSSAGSDRHHDLRTGMQVFINIV
jgi:hypothetical protein